ncbi:MAG TPA: hypothetical protein VJ861_08070 [Treponemataceae bacterium]|nr:hypothetical protein [Treponemataceae bacterium]
MENVKIDGVASFKGGEYGILTIDGKATCSGNISAETMNVDGIFKCSGEIQAGLLICDGVARVNGNVKAKKIIIDGILKIDGGNKLVAEEIDCDGLIKIDGEISADIIKIDGFIEAGEITGDSVFIRSPKSFFLSLFKSKRSKIRLIEATNVEIQGLRAQEVNGKDIRIECGCIIDSVDCSGTLWISPKAEVKNLSGNFTRIDS